MLPGTRGDWLGEDGHRTAGLAADPLSCWSGWLAARKVLRSRGVATKDEHGDDFCSLGLSEGLGSNRSWRPRASAGRFGPIRNGIAKFPRVPIRRESDDDDDGQPAKR